MAEEREDKPEEDTAAARETAVGQPIVEADAATTTSEQPGAPPFGEAGGTSPAAADRAAVEAHDAFTDRPELFVAGAFVGAFVVGKLLKRLTGGGG